MKFTLTDYQDRAASEVLERINQAKGIKATGLNSAFALTAATGAGKTVIAAAVVETLFETDPDVAVVWLTTDPSLNEQTRRRMLQASDTLSTENLTVIDDNSRFDQEEFAASNVYFLNVQKLHDASTKWVESGTNRRRHSLWDTFTNTVKSPATRLLVIIDEAHQGIGASGSASAKKTTMARLITGDDNRPPLSLVWGISATPERFSTLMKSAPSHIPLPNVTVDVADIRDSGLLKDVIVLDAPDETGQFGSTMLREAVGQTVAYDKAWAEYARREKSQPVKPVLVIQMGNKPSNASLADVIEKVEEEWANHSGESLPASAIVNVFGEHEDIKVGDRTVGYIVPEDIQDATHVRVVIAKDAITTGWDCPRAEVLFSFRGTKDYTTIAQMIGRVVRAPLARRILDDESLNSVACFLPEFNRAAVAKVIAQFSSGAEDEPPVDVVTRGEKVFVERNTTLDALEESIEVLQSLPSQTLPRLVATNSVTRAKKFALELSKHFPGPRYPEQLTTSIVDILEVQRKGLDRQVAEMVEDILHAEITRQAFEVFGGVQAVSDEAVVRGVDISNIGDAYAEANRRIPEGVIKDYERHLFCTYAMPTSDAFDDWDSTDTQVQAAAVGLIPSSAEQVEMACSGHVASWTNSTRADTKGLPEEARNTLRSILAQSRTPEMVDIDLPERISTAASTVTYQRHLFTNVVAGEDKGFPFKANSWEKKVLEQELASDLTVAWYRNPSQATAAALTITYQQGNKWKALQPDFVFFRRNSQGVVRPSIVDPHWTTGADSVPKIQALARYVNDNPGVYDRVDALAENSNKQMTVLDLTDDAVREFVLTSTEADATVLFDSAVALPY